MRGPAPTDHSGKTVGSYRVIRFSRKKGSHRLFLCECKCGRRKEIKAHKLAEGKPFSCLSCSKMGNKINLTHGRRHTTEYESWAAMKQRCLNPKNPHYPRWGGRGISICKRWLNSFENFYADMGQKPSPMHTLERKNNNGNYTPRNCIWGDKKQQANNRRNAPPRPSHPNSLANLRKMTSALSKANWDNRPQDKSKPKTCDHCGRMFYRRGDKRGKPNHAHIYCSRNCYFKAQFPKSL